MSGLPVPAVPAFYAGQAPTAQLNNMGNAFSFLLAKVAFRARRVATGTVTKGSTTLVPWDTIDEDPYTGWAAGAPTKYIAPAPGWYLCAGTLSISGTIAAGTVLTPAFSVQGSSPTGVGTPGWEGQSIYIPGGGPVVAAFWEGYCNAGDSIELAANLSSEPAANFAWTTTVGFQTRIEILWMGV